MRLRVWLAVGLLVLMMVVFAAGAAWMVALGYLPSGLIIGVCSIGCGWCIGQVVATERWERRR